MISIIIDNIFGFVVTVHIVERFRECDVCYSQL